MSTDEIGALSLWKGIFMITIQEVACVAGFALIAAFFSFVFQLIFAHELSKHLYKHKQEKDKAEAEKHDSELLNKAREVVFDDLCNYFNSVKGDNNEIQR